MSDLRKNLETIVLNEAKDTYGDVKVDKAKKGHYANEGQPKEFKDSVRNGNDMHKAKGAHKKANGGDNAMKLKEDIKAKLNKRWATIKESKLK